MATKRVYCVSQENLTVWRISHSSVTQDRVFNADAEGIRAFEAYLRATPDVPGTILLDVIEEEFEADSIPAVSGRDRRQLIERRLAKRFAHSPYRAGAFLGKKRRESDRFNVVFSSMTNQELLNRWMDCLIRRKSAVGDVCSVAQVAPKLLQKIGFSRAKTLVASVHRKDQLRQVFVKDGQSLGTRLSRVSAAAGSESITSIADEIRQSRRYFERSKHLRPDEVVDVLMIVSGAIAQHELSQRLGEFYQVQVVNVADVMSMLGFSSSVAEGNIQEMYGAAVSRLRIPQKYTRADTPNFRRLRAVRRSLATAVTLFAVIGCGLSGYMFMELVGLKRVEAEIENQLHYLEQNYRKDSDSMEPLRADSREMKMAVDTGDYIRRNSLPVDWVMQQVGSVMENYTDVHIDRIAWKIESAEAGENAAPQRPGDRSRPVDIQRADRVTATIDGFIEPYSGDVRSAFSEIDNLAKDLRANSGFQSVAVTAYPIDARPAVSLSGEISTRGRQGTAEFGLKLTAGVGSEP